MLNISQNTFGYEGKKNGHAAIYMIPTSDFPSEEIIK
jgi:hypothetical protein